MERAQIVILEEVQELFVQRLSNQVDLFVFFCLLLLCIHSRSMIATPLIMISP